jgi:enoyl-CoA hydratase/carnithine racemase
MADLVGIERSGSVASVTLNRPEKRNALSIALRRELAASFDALSADASVAVVVLTGAGPAFCAGMDKTEFGGDAAHRRDLYETSEHLFSSLGALARPVVGAINGPALGGGLALAALCDIRVAAPTATFGAPEIGLGIPPSIGALRRLLPDPVAREVAFTGRILDAAEALSLGMVAEVTENALERATQIAEQIAGFGVSVLEATKRIAIEAEDSAARAAWDAEMRLFRRVLFGEEPP